MKNMKNIFIDTNLSSIQIWDIKSPNTIFNNESELMNKWEKANFVVPAFDCGPVRPVGVDSYIKDKTIYLKTVEHLRKKEFEMIFGFNYGYFKKDKIIALSIDSVKII